MQALLPHSCAESAPLDLCAEVINKLPYYERGLTMLRKFLVPLLLLLCVFCLGGCGNNSDTHTAANNIQESMNSNRDIQNGAVSGVDDNNPTMSNSGKDAETVPLRFISVDAGFDHTAAVDEHGGLWMCGRNRDGEFGNSIKGDSTVLVKTMDNVASVSTGWEYTVALTEDGTVFSWGQNNDGQLGNGTKETAFEPQEIMHNCSYISAQLSHSAAITHDGELWTWGSDNNGRLGNGEAKQSLVPVKVLDNVVSASVGWQHTAAITNDGCLWCWGSNNWGQFCNGEAGYSLYGDSTVPLKIRDNVISVSCGKYHTAFIDNNNILWISGRNHNGQLGVPGIDKSYEPVNPLGEKQIVDVNAGDFCTIAVTREGEVWMWGKSIEYNDPTDEMRDEAATPVRVMDGIVKVGGMESHYIALGADGSVWTWGTNYYGELGAGDQDPRVEPVRIK